MVSEFQGIFKCIYLAFVIDQIAEHRKVTEIIEETGYS